MNKTRLDLRHPWQRCDSNSGFTLIEMLIILTIIGILASIAIPAYNNYTQRSKLAEGMTTLSNLRLQMEQYYQDNRSYATAGTTNCAITAPAGNDFTFSCTALTPTTYVWTATSSGSSLGSGNFVYTIDQDGNRATTKFKGSTATSTCWEVRPGKCS